MQYISDILEEARTPALLARVAALRRRLGLRAPGSYENLHRESKNVLPTLMMFDGAKVDLTSVLSPKFQVTHSFAWGAQAYPSTYSFGAGYVGDKAILHGQVDSEANLQARATYAWLGKTGAPQSQPAADAAAAAAPIDTLDLGQPALGDLDAKKSADTASISLKPGEFPAAEGGAPAAKERQEQSDDSSTVSSTSKLQAQFAAGEGQQSMVQFEHDHVGSDYAINVKAINPNPFDQGSALAGSPGSSSSTTGVFVLQYLQSVTPSLACGVEYIMQRPTPDISESTLAYAVKHSVYGASVPVPALIPAGMPSPYAPVNPADPVQVLAATFQPATGLLHSSYFRRINARLEVAAELQALLQAGRGRFQMGRREAVASVGFKLDTIYATIRAMVDTQGKASTVIEERLGQGLSFQISGEIDHAKDGGKVGVGFTLEA